MAPADYEPIEGRAKWAQRALVAVLVISALSLVSDFFDYRLYNQDVITPSEEDANDSRVAIVGLLWLASLVWAIVAFIRWFKRAYANTEALGARRRFRTGWAIWGWFVPILNLWRPKQIANDIWRASDPAADPQFGDYEGKPVPELFQAWWLVWIVSNFVDNASFRLSFSADTPDELSTSAAVAMASDVLNVVGAVLAILVVRRSTKRQQERARTLEGAAGEQGT